MTADATTGLVVVLISRTRDDRSDIELSLCPATLLGLQFDGGPPMNLLSRERMTDTHWSELCAVPQLVLLAVSVAGGSRLDAVLERSAGRRAIENGRNNDHPLIRAMADPEAIETAEASVESIAYDEAGSLRGAADLLALAASGAHAAADVLRQTGGELDVYAYREYVLGVARAVAEAAREGDFIGLGGQIVSDAERAVIAAISQALAT